ncbi:MAG: poly-beta-1,6-N-acetyl-D-glucosamine N-deacetylase PgaB [Gallionellaceae bacterium]|jgi:biofilm PGA synthesis lipoprotein PgaB
MAIEMPNPCSRDRNSNDFTIFSYHEIAEKSETLDSTYAVSVASFEAQMKWLVDNEYHFINIDDIINYRKHNKPLPSKAILITFDDGYQSVYTNAFPIIRKYKIPTVIALVGSWLQATEKVDFGGHLIDRSKFMGQKEIKEMVASGLVEIGSHSHLLHRGILGNPQGNMQPAAITRQWLSDKGGYEDNRSYQQRIYQDLKANNDFLKQYTGQKARVMVWPYGEYNMEVRKIAESLGMPVGLTLDDGSNTRITPLWGLRRILVDQKMSHTDMELNMWDRNNNFTDGALTTKAMHIDLDYIYDPDPEQVNKNLGELLERIKRVNVNTVYLQTFADPDANGAADYVYFPNRYIPVRSDLFNRVAWQIGTRTQVKRVYAWMPMIAWELPDDNPAANDKVVTLQVDKTHLNMGYPRLSPFSPTARKVIREIYEDLAKSTMIDGILFHDDVTLSDFEDDSVMARAQYKKWKLKASVSEIRANHSEFMRWTKLKTEYLDDFAMELAQIVRGYRPGLKTARNLYAQVALNKDAQEWYAQSLIDSINKYDYTAIMTMPYMEQADNAASFYDQIVSNVKRETCGLERTVFELQTVNWRNNDEPISPQELSLTIQHLYDLGVNHIAYYPDDLFHNNPDADLMKRDFAKKPIRMYSFTPNSFLPNK